MFYDPDLPSGCSDADLDSAALHRQAARESRLRRRGICTHGWYGPVVIGEPARICRECGAVFPSEAALEESRRAALD